MNPRPLLILSLIANLLLAGFLVKTLTEPPPATVTAPPPPARIPAQATPPPPSAPEPAAPATNTVVRKITWQMVESPDYRQYIDNLRSIGCPDETIRDIILADVNKLYEAKKKEVKGEPQEFEFWKGGNPWMANADPEVMRKLQALDAEKNQVLRALGIEPDFKTQAASLMNPMETMLDFLPEEKKGRMLKLFSDMQTRMAEAQRDGGGDAESVMKAQKEMEEAAQALLTPEEFLNYQLRFSMTANMLTRGPRTTISSRPSAPPNAPTSARRRPSRSMT